MQVLFCFVLIELLELLNCKVHINGWNPEKYLFFKVILSCVKRQYKKRV